MHFERDARRLKLSYERQGEGGNLAYRFRIDVPVHDEERLVTAKFAGTRSAVQALVYIDGPRRLRHRFGDDSLCMWFKTDPPEERWLPEDGLLELVRHVEEHAYCEAECRAGRPWPKPEAPGLHPRRRECPTCLGRCSQP